MSSATASKIDPSLVKQLLPVLRRERVRRVVLCVAITWVAIAAIAFLVFLVNQSAQSTLDLYIPGAWKWLGVLSLAGTLTGIAVAKHPDDCSSS